MAPVSSAYADVNCTGLYHELHGQGEPLVLIHGGLTTIGEMRGWVRPPAKTRRVIAVEMQGHGRTADTDCPLSFATLGDDVAALLDHLGILASLTERLLVRAYALQLRFPAPPTPPH
jgi:pimeloyl-ACP methyl ester carboxylesterase